MHFSGIPVHQVDTSGMSDAVKSKEIIDTKNIGIEKIETDDLLPTTDEAKFNMKGYDIPYIPGFRPIIDTI